MAARRRKTLDRLIWMQNLVTRSRNTFCWNCWRDWKDAFLSLSPWEQEQFIEKNPRVNVNDFERGKCPFCGASYDLELESWYDDLLFDEELEAETYEPADWEKD
jgi:hypothetical protein